MARTKHHSQKHGTVKGGEGTKRRACGYEYWGRRPGGKFGSDVRPSIARERMMLKRELYAELNTDR